MYYFKTVITFSKHPLKNVWLGTQQMHDREMS